MKLGKSYVNWLKKLTFINEAFSDQQLYQYKRKELQWFGDCLLSGTDVAPLCRS
jgi:hypothetical protein